MLLLGAFVPCAANDRDNTLLWLKTMEAGALPGRSQQEARTKFTRALAMLKTDSIEDAKVTVTLRYLGDSCMNLSDYATAAQCYQREEALLMRISPEYPDISYDQYQLGKIALLNGEFGKATALFQRALEIRKQYSQSLHEPRTNDLLLHIMIAQCLDGKLNEAKALLDSSSLNVQENTLPVDLFAAASDAKQLRKKLHLPIDHPITKLSYLFVGKVMQIDRQGADGALALEALANSLAEDGNINDAQRYAQLALDAVTRLNYLPMLVCRTEMTGVLQIVISHGEFPERFLDATFTKAQLMHEPGASPFSLSLRNLIVSDCLLSRSPNDPCRQSARKFLPRVLQLCQITGDRQTAIIHTIDLMSQIQSSLYSKQVAQAEKLLPSLLSQSSAISASSAENEIVANCLLHLGLSFAERGFDKVAIPIFKAAISHYGKVSRQDYQFSQELEMSLEVLFSFARLVPHDSSESTRSDTLLWLKRCRTLLAQDPQGPDTNPNISVVGWILADLGLWADALPYLEKAEHMNIPSSTPEEHLRSRYNILSHLCGACIALHKPDSAMHYIHELEQFLAQNQSLVNRDPAMKATQNALATWKIQAGQSSPASNHNRS